MILNIYKFLLYKSFLNLLNDKINIFLFHDFFLKTICVLKLNFIFIKIFFDEIERKSKISRVSNGYFIMYKIIFNTTTYAFFVIIYIKTDVYLILYLFHFIKCLHLTVWKKSSTISSAGQIHHNNPIKFKLKVKTSNLSLKLYKIKKAINSKSKLPQLKTTFILKIRIKKNHKIKGIL